jgi:hypothetical protein
MVPDECHHHCRLGANQIRRSASATVPQKYRPYYAGSVTAVETYFVVSNNRIGGENRFLILTKVQDMETMYAQMKTLEGQNIPLGV